jgi:hypothetical protein
VSCDSGAPLPGSTVTVEVRLGARRLASYLSAEVKWVQEAKATRSFGFGLIFQALSQDQRDQLESAIAEFRRRAAELA